MPFIWDHIPLFEGTRRVLVVFLVSGLASSGGSVEDLVTWRLGAASCLAVPCFRLTVGFQDPKNTQHYLVVAFFWGVLQPLKAVAQRLCDTPEVSRPESECSLSLELRS